MWPALPASDYYEGSVPPRSCQPTAGLPATGLADRQVGSFTVVPTFTTSPFDEGGAQLCPCNLATSTPQAFLVASQPTITIGSGVARSTGVRCYPAQIRQIGAGPVA